MIDLRWRRLSRIARSGIPDGRIGIHRRSIDCQRRAVLQTKVQGEIGVRAITSRTALHW